LNHFKAFNQAVACLTSYTNYGSNSIKRVSSADYAAFCKENLFDELRGLKFGEAFCKKFEISDFVLNILHSRDSAMKHIQTVGYIHDYSK